jgi:hypothetical protein
LQKLLTRALRHYYTERWWVTLPGSPWLDDPKDVLVDLGITTAGAAMAFIMSMSEFELVKETTAVSVMVIGGAGSKFRIWA